MGQGSKGNLRIIRNLSNRTDRNSPDLGKFPCKECRKRHSDRKASLYWKGKHETKAIPAATPRQFERILHDRYRSRAIYRFP